MCTFVDALFVSLSYFDGQIPYIFNKAFYILCVFKIEWDIYFLY